MKMSINKFREDIFGPNDLEMLLNTLPIYLHDQIKAYPYHSIIYEKDSLSSPFVIQSNHINTFHINESFEEFYNLFKNISYRDCLFLCTLFQINQKFINLIEIKKAVLDKDLKGLNYILFPDTYGIILYKNQLEELHSILTGCSTIDSISFRKDWNLKRPYARNKSLDLLLLPNYTLYDFIIDYSSNQHLFVFEPNYKGAWNLYSKIYKFGQI